MLLTAKKIDVVTIGSAVRDITFFTGKGKVLKTPEDLTSQKLWAFEYGAKIEIESFCDSLGGGAFNTSYNFNRLGIRAAPLVRVGDDIDGKWIKENMECHGISTMLVQTDQQTKTGLSMVMCSQKREHDHIIFVHRGANTNLQIEDKIFSRVRLNWFFISSLSGDHWLDTLKNIFDYAQSHNVKVAWNPGGAQLAAGKKKLEKYLKLADVLILNKDEAIELVLSGITLGKRDPKFLNKPVYLLNILNEWGPRIVVITLGKKGATALKGEKMYYRKIINTKVVDTTGVGDAFGAAFVSGLIYENMNVPRALAWGVFNSSFVVTKAGAHAGVLTKEEILEVLKKYY